MRSVTFFLCSNIYVLLIAINNRNMYSTNLQPQTLDLDLAPFPSSSQIQPLDPRFPDSLCFACCFYYLFFFFYLVLVGLQGPCQLMQGKYQPLNLLDKCLIISTYKRTLKSSNRPRCLILRRVQLDYKEDFFLP